MQNIPIHIITDSETDFKMRMRKKKHSAERIEACSAFLLHFAAQDGGYSGTYGSNEVSREIFGKPMPLELEIGCGKGDFAIGLSAARPEVGIIALERVADVAVTALEKAAATAKERPDNLRFIIGNAQSLDGWFPEDTFSRIYLNFSDPWPKKGYAKRRLTAPGFLELYRRLLIPGGELCFKTDNEGLFDWSLEQFAALGLEVTAMTRDLHSSEYAAGNIMTEYERNFTAKGMPIYMVRVIFNKKAVPAAEAEVNV